MGLGATLTATVVAIVAWCVRVENGGMLNYLFKANPVPNGTDFRWEFNSAGFLENFLKMLLLQPLDLPILEAMSEEVGGGPANVEKSHSSPNREPYILWITVGVFFFTFLLIMVIGYINCSCCNRKKYPSLNCVQQAMTTCQGSYGDRVGYIVYMVLLVIALLFMVASIIMIIIYFCSVGIFLDHLGKSSEETSVLGSLQSFQTHLLTFIDRSAQEGNRSTGECTAKFIGITDTGIESGTNTTVEGLLKYLTIPDVLSQGQDTDKYLETFAGEVEETAATVNGTKSAIDKHCEFLKNVQGQFDKVASCTANSACKDLWDEFKNMKCPNAPTIADIAMMVKFIAKVKEVKQQIGNFTEQMNTALVQIDANKGEIVTSIKNQMNIESLLDPLSEIWHQLGLTASQLEGQLEGMNGQLEPLLSAYVPYVGLVFYVIGGIFAILLIILALSSTRVFYRSFVNGLCASAEVYDPRPNRCDKCVCGRCSVCCCSGILVLVFLIFTIIIAILFFVLTFVAGELCIYVTRDTAVQKMDFVTRGIVAREWSSLVQDASQFLSSEEPEGLFQALTTSCQSDSLGLLSALGITNLVDITNLLKSEAVTEGIAKGRVEIVEEVKKMEIPAKLPPDSEMDEFITDIEGFGGLLDLKPLIQILNPDSWNTASMETLIGSLKELSLDDFDDAIGELEKVNASMGQLKAMVGATKKSVEATQVKVAKFPGHATALPRQIKDVNAKAKDEPEMTKEVQLQYDKMTADLLNSMEDEGEPLFENFTKSLFPCKEAHEAFTTLTGFSCGDAGLLNLFIGVIYVLALTLLFVGLAYFSLFNLSWMQAVQLFRLADDLSEKDDFEKSDFSDTFDDDRSTVI